MLPNVCRVCNGPATRSCRMCGKMACEAHFENSVGVCIVCLGVRAEPKK